MSEYAQINALKYLPSAAVAASLVAMLRCRLICRPVIPRLRRWEPRGEVPVTEHGTWRGLVIVKAAQDRRSPKRKTARPYV
jgi:hypothetical protein